LFKFVISWLIGVVDDLSSLWPYDRVGIGTKNSMLPIGLVSDMVELGMVRWRVRVLNPRLKKWN
jgi:hypothetical protein